MFKELRRASVIDKGLKHFIDKGDTRMVKTIIDCHLIPTGSPATGFPIEQATTNRIENDEKEKNTRKP
jgi:hypothetical protein